MTDKELLELAAKAAGIVGKWWPEFFEFRVPHPDTSQLKDIYGIAWNPLTNDGDALRLAIKLDIVPRCINGVAFAWRAGVCDMQEPYGTDPYAATRRAIVRAAAEIGEQMKC